MDDKAQQQEDLQLLTVGVLLFGDDLKAIRRTLLPGCKVKLSEFKETGPRPEDET
jgi:hypothetical protein